MAKLAFAISLAIQDIAWRLQLDFDVYKLYNQLIC